MISSESTPNSSLSQAQEGPGEVHHHKYRQHIPQRGKHWLGMFDSRSSLFPEPDLSRLISMPQLSSTSSAEAIGITFLQSHPLTNTILWIVTPQSGRLRSDGSFASTLQMALAVRTKIVLGRIARNSQLEGSSQTHVTRASNSLGRMEAALTTSNEPGFHTLKQASHNSDRGNCLEIRF